VAPVEAGGGGEAVVVLVKQEIASRFLILQKKNTKMGGKVQQRFRFPLNCGLDHSIIYLNSSPHEWLLEFQKFASKNVCIGRDDML